MSLQLVAETEEGRTVPEADEPRRRTIEIPIDDGLERELEARGAWGELVEHLIDRAAGTEAPEEAAMLLRRAALALERRIGDAGRAFLTMEAAFRQDPANGAVLSDLERLAERLGRLDELVSAAEGAMFGIEDPTSLADLWARIARWSRRLGHSEQAQTAAESALGIVPHHEGALRELEDAYRQREQWGPLARLLARRLRMASGKGPAADRGEILELHLEMAAVYEDRLGDADRAIASCEKALALDPGSEAALARLERLAERQRRPLLHIDVLERRLARTPAGSERATLALALAQAWEGVGRPDRARNVLEAAAADGGQDPALYRALAPLHAAAGAWESFVEVARKHLPLARDAAERAQLGFALGHALLTELQRGEEAERALEAVLVEAPGHPEATRLLAERWRAGADWGRLGDLLIRAGKNAADLGEKTKLFLEAASVYRDRLGDPATARDLYGWVAQLAPENREAALALADEAEEREEWERVRTLLRPLVDRPGKASPARRADWHARLARAAGRLGREDERLVDLREAARLCPDDEAHLTALADTLFARDRQAEAAALYERLWTADRCQLDDGARAERAYRIGQGRRARGDLAGAIAAFEEALRRAPTHRGALLALASLAEAEGDFATVLGCRRTLFEAAEDPTEKVALARELAATAAEKLGAPQEAVRILRGALVALPGSRALLADLLDLHVAGAAWSEAVDVLLTIANLEAGATRAKYLSAAANILHHSLGAHERALDLYNRALDEDPEDLKSFERIDRILTALRRFQDQERNYRRMLWRLRKKDDARSRAAQLMLWRGLGEIYRSRLNDLPAAAAAFEVVARLDRGSPVTRQILGELYARGGTATYGRAVEQRVALIRGAADPTEMARQLRSVLALAMSAGDRDRAWRAADALVSLDAAGHDERRIHAGFVAEPELPAAPVPAASWPMLLHADEDPRLSQLFAAAGRALLTLRSRAAAEWGLREPSPEERAGIEDSLLARLLTQMAGVLSVPRPHLQFRPDLPGTVEMAGVRADSAVAPTLVAGADMLRVRSRRELVCVLGKKMTLMRPEHWVLWPAVVPTLAELQVVIQALQRTVGVRPPVPRKHARVLARYERVLRRTLGPQDLERAAALVPELGGPREIARWARGAFLTASRVGYLVGGDLATTVRTASAESIGALTVTPFDQIRDVVAWSISDQHASVRRQLALAPLAALEPVAADDDDRTTPRARILPLPSRGARSGAPYAVLAG